MGGLAYLALASQQRGDAPQPYSYEGERLRFWCSACASHRVLNDGDECPVCEPLCTCAFCRARREVPR